MLKTRIRTAKACNNCRLRKVKCDGLSHCPNCARYGVECVYMEELPDKPRKKRGRKPSKNKIYGTNTSTDQVTELHSRIARLETTVQELLARMDQIQGTSSALSESGNETEVVTPKSEVDSPMALQMPDLAASAGDFLYELNQTKQMQFLESEFFV